MADRELLEILATAHGFQLAKVYSEEEAARFLGVHKNTLAGWRREGRLYAIRMSHRNIRYLGLHLAEYLAGQLDGWQKSSLLETSGYQSNPEAPTGAGHGTAGSLGRQNALAYAQQILKKPSGD